MLKEASIDSRVPVDTDVQPIKVLPEHLPRLEAIKSKAEELNQLRQELGRLLQVLDNIKNNAHSTERELTRARQDLISNYPIVDGSWAIDFANGELVKLHKSAPLTP